MLSREGILMSSFRSFPDSIKFISFLNYIANPTNNNLFLFIMFFSGTITNFALKKIMMNIYKLTNKGKLPILGLGGRPKGASSCSTFLTFDNKLSKSFGMPSGHSQMGWLFASYFIFQIWDPLNYENEINNTRFNDDYSKGNKEIIKIIQTILLVLFGITMSYTRVYVEKCHTLQQVVVGALFGSGLGFLAYYLKPYILK